MCTIYKIKRFLSSHFYLSIPVVCILKTNITMVNLYQTKYFPLHILLSKKCKSERAL